MKGKQHVLILEKTLMLSAIILITILFGYNFYTTYNSLQSSVVQNKYKQYNLQAMGSPYGEVAIEIDEEQQYPKLELLINGVTTSQFNNEKRVIAKVKDGDLIQVNGSMYQQDITVSIVEVSNNLEEKLINTNTTTYGNIQILTTIRIQ